MDAGYDFASVAGDAAALLAALGWRRPLIVGHSWGADVALELAAAQPELASGLVFVDGGTIEPSAAARLDAGAGPAGYGAAGFLPASRRR